MSLTHDGTSLSYRYNASGMRIEKFDGSESRCYVYDQFGQLIFEESSGGTYKEYLYAFGHHLARVDGVILSGGGYQETRPITTIPTRWEQSR